MRIAATLLALSAADAFTLPFMGHRAPRDAMAPSSLSDNIMACTAAAVLIFGSPQDCEAMLPTTSMFAAASNDIAIEKAVAKAQVDQAKAKMDAEVAAKRLSEKEAKAAAAAEAAAKKEASLQEAAVQKAIALQEKAVAEAAKNRPASAGPVLSAKAAATDVTLLVKPGSVNLKDLKLPSSVGISLPVLGPVRISLNLVAEKTTPEAVAASDILVVLPANLIKAGKLAVGGDAGLIIDAPGLVSGKIDLDIATPRAGEADVTLTSSLIPKVPLQKGGSKGRFCFECGNGQPASDWVVSRNLGNGVEFYSNTKTGKSQFEVPPGF